MLIDRAPSDEELLRFVDQWIDALACGDYAGAFAMTEHDPYYRWSPELIRSVIQGYGLPEPHRSGETFSVTSREAATGGPPDREVNRETIRPDVLAEVICDLPLNGVWSDLTATFRAERRADSVAIVLQEIHVF
jgi:hypothetical protein